MFHQRSVALRLVLLAIVALGAFNTGSYGGAQFAQEQDTPAESRARAESEAFRARDTDADGSLTLDELGKGGGENTNSLQRDFIVFDANNDGLLSPSEFLTIPAFTPEDQRSQISDPVVMLSEANLAILKSQWPEWDQDHDGFLSTAEFKADAIGELVPGLETTRIEHWDFNKDSKVSLEEAALLLDIAFGVRVESGERLRSTSGNVADWGFFHALDPDGDGRVHRAEYLRAMNGAANADEWYQGLVKDGSDSFGIAEFVVSNHRTSPVQLFLQCDADLNGRLSPDELTPVPWGPQDRKWLPGFDDDFDGAYSLREFMLIPHVNLLAAWHTAQDADQNGMLSADEFRFMPPPALVALTAEYFRRLDIDQDQQLSLREWPFQTSHPDAKFILIDSNSDDELSDSEFKAEGSLPASRLHRDFVVFDADSNGRLTREEFLTIPHWVPENLRLEIPDPVAQLSQNSFQSLISNWPEADKDTDGFLNPTEFETSGNGSRVRGLESSTFSEWDRDHDGKVSQDEVAMVLDIAFGVRSPTGEYLRSKSGRIVDWRSFLGMNPDGNGKVRQESYIQMLGSVEKAVEWFPTIMESANRSFGVTEFATSRHLVDPISQFLAMDVDLDGLLGTEEMEALPAWGPPGKNWLPGFDDNGDGFYSMSEFRLIPQVNLLTTWHAARDADNNGKVSPKEFRFMPSPSLAALTAEYFRRLDLNKNGALELREWPFSFDIALAPSDMTIQLRDKNDDGKLSLDEILADVPRLPSNDLQQSMAGRYLDAFQRADNNGDKLLDAEEMATDAGMDAVSPGTVIKPRAARTPMTRPETRFLGMDGATMQNVLLIEVGFVLITAAGIFVIRRIRAS